MFYVFTLLGSSMCGGDEKYVQNFNRETRKEESLRKICVYF